MNKSDKITVQSGIESAAWWISPDGKIYDIENDGITAQSHAEWMVNNLSRVLRFNYPKPGIYIKLLNELKVLQKQYDKTEDEDIS